MILDYVVDGQTGAYHRQGVCRHHFETPAGQGTVGLRVNISVLAVMSLETLNDNLERHLFAEYQLCALNPAMQCDYMGQCFEDISFHRTQKKCPDKCLWESSH